MVAEPVNGVGRVMSIDMKVFAMPATVYKLVIVAVLLLFVVSGVVLFITRESLLTAQEQAYYYYREYYKTSISSGWEMKQADRELRDLKLEMSRLKNKLAGSGEAITKLERRNYNLRCRLYDLQVKSKPRNFENSEELRAWLDSVPICITLGDKAMDCDNFAIGLQNRALRDGYILSFADIWASEYNHLFREMSLPSGARHAINLAIAGNEIYYIEPQNLEFVYVTRLD